MRSKPSSVCTKVAPSKEQRSKSLATPLPATADTNGFVSRDEERNEVPVRIAQVHRIVPRISKPIRLDARLCRIEPIGLYEHAKAGFLGRVFDSIAVVIRDHFHRAQLVFLQETPRVVGAAQVGVLVGDDFGSMTIGTQI